MSDTPANGHMRYTGKILLSAEVVVDTWDEDRAREVVARMASQLSATPASGGEVISVRTCANHGLSGDEGLAPPGVAALRAACQEALDYFGSYVTHEDIAGRMRSALERAA